MISFLSQIDNFLPAKATNVLIGQSPQMQGYIHSHKCREAVAVHPVVSSKETQTLNELSLNQTYQHHCYTRSNAEIS